jgi:hypothetical protein
MPLRRTQIANPGLLQTLGDFEMKKTYWILIALAVLALPNLMSASALAQAPNGIQVRLPGDGANQLIFDTTSGTETNRGITVTWDIGTSSATFSFLGTYATEWISPDINMTWFSIPENFPMSIQVVSNTSSQYNFEAPYNTDGWNFEHNQVGLTESYNFGTYFPASSRVDIALDCATEGDPYDISVTMAWGEGTADYAATMSSVKALYR